MARMWIGCGSCRWRSVLSMPGMRIVRVPGMGWGWRSHLVAGMRVGGRRTLLIPSGYGYGRRGAGGVIPPNASLVFEVELLDVKPH